MKAPVQNQRLFSVDEANRMLPLIKRIVSDIVALSEKLDERQFRLDALDREQNRLRFEALDFEEWDRMQQEIDADEDRLEEYIDELVELGVELQDASIGEVDFRTQVNGDDAYLCWRLGESVVTHWHSEDSGYEDRRLLFHPTLSPKILPPSQAADN